MFSRPCYREGAKAAHAQSASGSKHRLVLLFRAHPEMFFLPHICVALKKESSEYQTYACGSFSRAP
jgi:hypothetical protein